MASVKVPRQELMDGTLPKVCIICGKKATCRRFRKLGAPSLFWLLFMPIAGLMAFWLNIIVYSFDSDNRGFPFCGRHRYYWPLRAWFMVLGGVFMVGTIILGAILTPPKQPGAEPQTHWLLGVGGCWMLIYLVSFLIVQLSTIRPIAGSRDYVTLSGAHFKFIEALEDMEDEDEEEYDD